MRGFFSSIAKPVKHELSANLNASSVGIAWPGPSSPNGRRTIDRFGLQYSQRPHQEAQAMALCEIVEMFGANPRKAHDLCVGEDVLVRFNCNHGSSSADSGGIHTFENSDAAKGRLMNRSQKSLPRLIQEHSSCAKEPCLESHR